MSDPGYIRGWQRLTGSITTSGMPQAGELAALAALGVSRVIDLTATGSVDALEHEGEKLAKLGIAYHHLPVPFDEAPGAYYADFVNLLEASPAPTHVHCVANWRVSAFFYRYHLESGIPESQARAMMRQQWEPDASDHPAAAPWKDFVQQAKARAASLVEDCG